MTHQNWDFRRGRTSSRTVSRGTGRCKPTGGEAGAAGLAGRRQTQAGCRRRQGGQLEAQGTQEPEEPDTEHGVMEAAGQRGVIVLLITPFPVSVPYR